MIFVLWGVLMGTVSYAISKVWGLEAQLLFLPVAILLSVVFGWWYAKQ